MGNYCRERSFFSAQEQKETYYSIIIPDYVSVLARTPSGMIPIVRQFRPAIERYTWELPAGLIDSEEQPQTVAIRELKEGNQIFYNKKRQTEKFIGTDFYYLSTNSDGKPIVDVLFEADKPYGNFLNQNYDKLYDWWKKNMNNKIYLELKKEFLPNFKNSISLYAALKKI